ncbi:MAG: LacI family DNA-binding transcriptional regulator [Solirubrobacteraceae bacterium]|nr:LacI family DNA-binding transcriptional regulator [Solirubrobacteraceae bacterium]
MPIPLDNSPDGQAARPTLRTLAEHTGLHISTISRALRQAPDASPTAALVHSAAEQLGYRRDPVAASLRTRRSGAIGMVAHSLTDIAQALIYEQVDQVAVAHGYDVLVAATGDDPRAQRRRVELLLSRRVDGLVIADAHRDGEYVEWIAALGVPYVLVMRSSPGHPSIACDDYAGGRLVGEHLIEQGHRDFALIAGPDYSAVSWDRAEGYRAALAEHGISVAEHLVEAGGLHTTTGRAGMERLLDRRRDFTAVFCAGNDFAAFGAISALKAAGIEPGTDVAVVGFNDVAAAEAMELTTVASPVAELGQLAATQLLAAIDGATPTPVRAEPSLIVRASSATPLYEMPRVGALR